MTEDATSEAIREGKAILAHGPNTAYISRASSQHVRDVIAKLVTALELLEADMPWCDRCQCYHHHSAEHIGGHRD